MEGKDERKKHQIPKTKHQSSHVKVKEEARQGSYSMGAASWQ
jgi:hypothetical protein